MEGNLVNMTWARSVYLCRFTASKRFRGLGSSGEDWRMGSMNWYGIAKIASSEACEISNLLYFAFKRF